jgi:hypothetical protein
LAVSGSKQRALLAMLLLHANEVVSTERLIDELWGEQPPETAGKSLQIYVSRLRKALRVNGHRAVPPAPHADDDTEPVITRPRGDMIRVRPGELDLERWPEPFHVRRERRPPDAHDDPHSERPRVGLIIARRMHRHASK